MRTFTVLDCIADHTFAELSVEAGVLASDECIFCVDGPLFRSPRVDRVRMILRVVDENVWRRPYIPSL
jgi:hypothetical protein